MCLFSIGSHTFGPRVLKLGMGDHIYPWEVVRIHFALVPQPPRSEEAKEWFWTSVQPKGCILVKMFIKQKNKVQPQKWGDGSGKIRS